MSNRKKNPPPSEGKRIGIYARKSDLKEESRGRSVREQVEACKFAAQSLGLQVDERLIFSDEDGCKGYWHYQDSEGRNPPPFRNKFTQLVREVEAGNVDIIMCWRAERCFRDEIVAALFLRKLVAHGVRLFALTQDLYIHTTTGYTNTISEANMSRAYSDKIADDIKRRHESNARNGLLPGNGSMYGFRSAGVKTGRVVPVENEQVVVRLIFEWYIYGPEGGRPLSCGAIADRLQRHGFKLAVGARGHTAKFPNKVHSGRISSILRNPAYCGYIGFNGDLFATDRFDIMQADGSMASAVPRELWYKAQERLDGRVVYPRGDGKMLLGGLTVCPDCGRKTYAQSRGKLDRNYYCVNRGGKGGCQGNAFRTVKCRHVEEWVKEYLSPLIAGEMMALRSERTGEPLRRELATLEIQARKLRTAETETLTQHILSGLDVSQLTAIGARLRSERESIDRRIADLRLRLQDAEFASSDPLELVAADEEAVRQALHRAVRWIALTVEGIVVYTRDGSLIGARYVQLGEKPRSYGHVRGIQPPTVEASEQCLDWIESPDSFLAGLRRPTSFNRVQTPDHELVPAELLDRVRKLSVSGIDDGEAA